MRILVAEDETIIRLDIVSLLTSKGLDVCAVARDGIEAVELAREHEPDLALLDVKMPRLDGIEAARRITAERPIPVVMLTSYDERSLISRAIEAGAGGYLVKPFKESDLVPALRTAAARHAELLAARRELGARGTRSIDLEVHGRGGQSWPLRLREVPGGKIDCSLWEKPENRPSGGSKAG